MSLPHPSPLPTSAPPLGNPHAPPNPQAHPGPQIDICTPASQEYTGHVSAGSPNNSDMYINGDSFLNPGHHKLVQPQVRPQNYKNAQDPTMQSTRSVPQQPGSRFDELYQKVLKDAEGALVQAQEEAAGTVLHKASSVGSGGDSGKGDGKESEVISEPSQHSQHSSHHSHRSQKGSQGRDVSKPGQLQQDIDGSAASLQDLSKRTRAGAC